MPIYAYRCSACGFEKDVLQKLSDAPLTECPSCGQAAFGKTLTAPNFQLKGTGWYVTDFRDGNKGKKPGEAGADKAPADAAAPAGDAAGGAKAADGAASGGGSDAAAGGSKPADKAPAGSAPAPARPAEGKSASTPSAPSPAPGSSKAA